MKLCACHGLPMGRDGFYRDGSQKWTCRVAKAARQKRYDETGGGAARNLRYRRSWKRRVVYQRYNQSEKGRAAQQRYNESAHGFAMRVAARFGP